MPFRLWIQPPIAACCVVVLVGLTGACRPSPSDVETEPRVPMPTPTEASVETPQGGVLVAKVGDPVGSRAAAALRAAFVERNRGYDLELFPRLSRLEAGEEARIVFVQSVPGEKALVDGGPAVRARVGEASSELTAGDLVSLHPGEALHLDSEVAAVVFTVPESPGEGVPTWVRPDWDPHITDVLGGCATEEGAYRRILLTWLRDNGPYTFRSLNAHRVRITDSFTHYHPREGGFDEFYLVQMSRPGAKLLTSTEVAAIESPGEIGVAEASDLFVEHDLEAGDLIYIPRGVIHRGVGGALVQVITTPGFLPGAEIGVDHHLLAINERLELTGSGRVPFHAAAANEPLVK